MRRLRVRFDSKLTQAIAELASRHGMSKANVVQAAISTYKVISDLDLRSLSDKSHPRPRFSEKLQTLARQEEEPYEPAVSTNTATNAATMKANGY